METERESMCACDCVTEIEREDVCATLCGVFV